MWGGHGRVFVDWVQEIYVNFVQLLLFALRQGEVTLGRVRHCLEEVVCV